MSRTTVSLDKESRQAARHLARYYDCSLSAAVRTAVVRHRNSVYGIPQSERRRRTQVLERLFELFKDVDPDEEIARVKAEDEGF